ncbi:MetQ/NlpA family ABC transporter substrate-binding protein [Fructilactobacillus sp. Tb1]|uniref:MetQ/NlpA family ABC transporter substrate-binding protein n=1 Tax=Fructilactobacillus sp. Tb1 TaxID=3422304 RepID=UPI003D27266A
MKKSVKWIISIIAVVAIVGIGWLSFGPKDSSTSGQKVVKVGIMSGSKADDAVWKSVAETAKDKYDIKLKFVHFTDYTQPNTALSQHSVDLNAFQHYAFLKDWNQKHHTDITSIGNTVITPIRLFSDSYKNVKDLPDGASIAIPNDATNESRALVLLKNAGLIELKHKDGLLGVNDITKNSKNLKIQEVDASQTPRLLNSVDASVVNGNYAATAKLPNNKAIFTEPLNKDSKPWINFIAANKDQKDNATYKKVVKAYQTKKTADVIEKEYGKTEVPAWNHKFN